MPVHRRQDRVVVDLFELNHDLRLHLLQVHRGALMGLGGGNVAGNQFGDPRHLALQEHLARLQLTQLRLNLPVIEPHQHVALGDALALAIADIDDAVADQAGDLGPAHRLDAAGGIDDLHRGAARGRGRLHLGPLPELPPEDGGGQQQHDEAKADETPVFHTDTHSRHGAAGC